MIIYTFLSSRLLVSQGRVRRHLLPCFGTRTSKCFFIESTITEPFVAALLSAMNCRNPKSEAVS